MQGIKDVIQLIVGCIEMAKVRCMAQRCQCYCISARFDKCSYSRNSFNFNSVIHIESQYVTGSRHL